MLIGQKEVKAISRLAAISVAETEVEMVAEKLSNILDLFSQMKAVNTDGIQPMAHPLDQVQRLRDDVVTETDNHQKYQKIAPLIEDKMYLVPQVVG